MIGNIVGWDWSIRDDGGIDCTTKIMGHGSNAIEELGAHFVMTNTTLTGAEGDDISSENDFRNVGIVVDPTNFGTSTVATADTARQTFAI